MDRIVNWVMHHLVLLGALCAVGTLLGFGSGAGLYVGGASWEHAVEIGRYLSSVMFVPAGLIWAANLLRDLRNETPWTRGAS